MRFLYSIFKYTILSHIFCVILYSSIRKQRCRLKRKRHHNPYTQGLLHKEVFTQRNFLHTENFIQRSLYSKVLLQKSLGAFTHKNFYTKKSLYRGLFTHKRVSTQKLLHKEAFTQRSIYTQKCLHTASFYTHKGFYTEKPLHRVAFYTQKILHREVFVQRRLYTK